ncbi:MAG: hypothetical protein PHE15_06680, partial [Dehalococcoidales bacterium]|nr:hypothetical protein [Dehalococcoidales bacterium]
TLQVAKDSSFSTAGTVLEIAGLAVSTYTPPEGQAFVKLADNASYYWRVQATDGAANSGAWSTVNTFTVGSTWPEWLMWVWIGIGVVVVFVFAIWLGKRMAYSSY